MHRVKAERPRISEGEIKEDEAIKDRRIPAIVDRKKALRRMRQEVGNRHRARRQKRCRPGEQAQRDQRPANQLDNARVSARVVERQTAPGLFATRKEEELLRSVSQEKQPRHDSQQAADDRCIIVQTIAAQIYSPAGSLSSCSRHHLAQARHTAQPSIEAISVALPPAAVVSMQVTRSVAKRAT
jgi:hypothetical protein